MKRRVNIRFLLISLVLLAAAGTGVHLLHAYQVRRNASAFLREADRYEKEGDDAKASEYLGRYLGLRPDDTDTLARYALLQDKLAKTYRAQERVFLLFEQVLRKDPTRQDIRRRNVQVALQLKRFTDARTHLGVLLAD